MKKTLLCSLFILLPFFISAQDVVEYLTVPNAYETTPGNLTFTGPLANAARTLQLLINENQLTSFIGKDLKGISWRLPASATANWPAAETVYPNYDIYLSKSVAPVDRSLTFLANVIGNQILVRSGSLTIPVDAYIFGGSPCPWGPEISFDSAYYYIGGHLLIEVRQNASNGTSRSVDALGTSGPGYGTDVSGIWIGNYTPPATGTQANFSIVRITADIHTPVELTSFTAAVINDAVELNWSTATETNNKGFQVERRLSDGWQNLGFVTGAGTTTESRKYSFADKITKSGSFMYRLKQIDYSGKYEYSKALEVKGIIASEFSLDNCYPNPANPGTIIAYNVGSESQVRIVVYNIMGQVVKEICNQKQDAGNYKVTLDGKDMASGIYLYTMQAVSTSGNEHFTSTKKFVLIK